MKAITDLLEGLREDDLREMIKEYEAKIEELEACKLMEPVTVSAVTMQKCPVCMGVGVLPIGFYNMTGIRSTTGASPEQCRSCGGRGIV